MTYLITGAGRGIGLEFTRQLLEDKKNVIAWLRDPEKSPELKKLKEKFSNQLQIQKVDITSHDSIAQAAKSVTTLDVLINNAGVLLDKDYTFHKLPKKVLQDTFDVNVYAPIEVTQNLLPALQKSSSPVLVNVSSKMGSIDDNSGGAYYAYRISKTAVNMFTKSFSVDHPNIKALCVHPGWVQTDMGGAGAAITKEQSVAGLLKVIAEHQKYKSGSFVEYSGKELPW